MPDSLQRKKSLKLGCLYPVKDRFSKLFCHSPPPQAARTQQATAPYTPHLPTLVPRSRSPNNAPYTIPVSLAKSPTSSIQAPPVTESTARNVHSGNSLPQDNTYAAIGGISTTAAVPETRVQRAKAVGSVAYEGVKLVLRGLSDCADMCPPLKTAVEGLLTVIELVDVCGSIYPICS